MGTVKYILFVIAVLAAARATGAENSLTAMKDTSAVVAPNADTYLKIDIPKTYWDADQRDRHRAVHPSIIYVDDSLWGYRYWMAFTPYDAAHHENPSIVVSNDGDNWLPFVSSSGMDTLINPVFDQEDVINSLHLSDPDIFLENEDSLWMIFRASYRKQCSGLLVSVTTDGILWSEPKSILDGKRNLYSPAVLRLDGGDYAMWLVESQPDPNRVLLYRSPRPDSGWTLVDTCAWFPSDTILNDIWHIEVLPAGDGKLAALVTETVGPGIDLKQLYLAESADGGITWVTRPEPLLKAGSDGAWDGRMIYRSSGVLTVRDSAMVLDLFYSAGGYENLYWHIGRTGVLLPPFNSIQQQ